MMVGPRLGIDWIKWSEEINLKKVYAKGITIRAYSFSIFVQTFLDKPL